jgi:dienelactone hydrolase
VRLSGFLLKGSGRIAVLAHPCEGLLREDGTIWPKYRRMANTLNNAGLSVLLVDSFTPRGKRNICSESSKTRAITADTRKKDNLAALAYLRARPDLPQGKALLVGWGSASVLETISERESTHRFDAAVTWYPPCQGLGPVKPTAPVLVLVGEKDDWNPAAACQALAARLPSSPTFQVAVFPETYHSFDTPNRPQRSVRWAGGVSMVGSNPQATEEAYRRIMEFVSLNLPAASGTPK